ncbi:thioredoxin-like protein [Daldinia decipiens]|uniref:thioredoxin-like protein n=1 Tax=Daldinia decipiens TaxID=326647 RepID=UPI0020C2DC58|nr:thioredoxin-like protein [Daldinia decipiens]KAI1662204.1 thioredoxin-like protein [Daldinia decipiens]
MARIRDLLLPVDDKDTEEVVVKKEDETTRKADIIPPETTRFFVEFILDVICPYCYIGFKNLKTAIETYRARHLEAIFEIVCTPFLLHPLAARSAYDKSDYLIARTRGPAYWVGPGQAAGINFTWAGRTGSTRNAHKLLRFALESTPTTTRGARNRRGASAPPLSHTSTRSPSSPSATNGNAPARGPALQLRLLEALFRAHHESDGDISDPSFLAETASAATGFTSAQIRAVLEDASEVWGRAVSALVAEVSSPRGLAVRAVPTFVVNDHYVIGGVQSAEFLVDEFERIRRGRGGYGVGG